MSIPPAASPHLSTQTGHALKEWSIAIDAALSGELTVLLRKGGIHDRKADLDRLFRPDGQPEQLLFPTVEHQKPELLKPEYADRVRAVPSGWHPEMIAIQGWVEIAAVLPVTSLDRALSLLPYFVWNEQFVHDRWNWKPERPLYALVLRAHRLDRPVEIPFDSKYGGCRSQIELDRTVVIDRRQPAIVDAAFAATTTSIRAILTD